MALTLFYSNNRRTVPVSISSDYSGFVTSEDAEQIAEGFRREFNQEPTAHSIATSCIDLAKKRKQVRI